MRSLLLLTLTLILSLAAIAQDMRPKILSMPEYVIPPEAEKAGITGSVSVIVWVQKDGTVDRVDFWSGPSWPCSGDMKGLVDDVRNGVMENFKKARFSPALRSGEPIDGSTGLRMLVGAAYTLVKEKSKQKDSATGNAFVDSTSPLAGPVINGKAISLPKPEYPGGFNNDKPRGTVEVEVLVGEDGSVLIAGATGGDPRLQKPARKAACKARFSPTLLSGQPVKVSGRITYNFVPY
jgi:TonB family protein